MSDLPTAGGGAVPGQEGEPSEEEVRAYLGQLRAAPVDQVVAEVASALLNAAQVKLGRQDGRLLIDLVEGVTGQVRGRLPTELTSQLDDVVAQLKLAQVEAEREVAAATAQGHAEPDDLSAGAETPAGDPADRPAARTPPPAGGGPASRLWVPGS